MKLNKAIFLSLFLLLSSEFSLASEFDYKCNIERVVSSEVANESSLKFYIGQEFTVDRKTGMMVGALKNSYVTKPQVIDFGSNENSYKVIASLKVSEGAGAGSNIYALTISEFIRGSSKPFVFLQNSNIFLGSCKHF